MKNYSLDEEKNISTYVLILAFYLVMLPAGTLHIEGVGSLLKIIGLLPVAYWFFAICKIKKSRLQLAVVCFVGMCAFSIIWSVDRHSSFERTITQLAFLFLIISATANRYNEREIHFLKKASLYSSRLTAILVIIFGGQYQGRLVLSGIMDEDPNYLCAYFFFGLAFTVTSIMNPSLMLWGKILYAIELIAYNVIIVATGSRGGVLAAIMCLTIAFFYGQHTLRRNISKQIVSYIVSMLLIIITVYIVSIVVDVEILNRFLKETILNSGGTGRFDIWNKILTIYTDSNIFRECFGYGTATVLDVLQANYSNQNHVAHNVFIENLLEIGAIGLIAYSLMIIEFVRHCVRNKDVYCLAVMLGMITLSMSTSITCFKPYWNIMLLVCCTKNEKGKTVNA